MKTVKSVSEIMGISIRALRYYDEIGLLKPTQLTEGGYRLYDDKALEKLQIIMAFRELGVPLADVKKVMDSSYNKKQTLSVLKSLLEHEQNRLDKMIELITDSIKGKGINNTSFGIFDKPYVQQMVDVSLKGLLAFQ